MAERPIITKEEVAALAALKPTLRGAAASNAVTHLLNHGSLHAFTHTAAAAIKMSAMMADHPDTMHLAGMVDHVSSAFAKVQKAATYFFQLVDDAPCPIDSSLIAYLTLPTEGVMYNTGYQPSDLPASITFMGQFIDHDLTKNGTNLVDPENNSVQDLASPLIDLDSVFGPRSDAGSVLSPKTPDGKFQLRKLGNNNAYDVIRDGMGNALIPDGRNDENQLILQVHLLIMRVYNLLIKNKHLSPIEAQRETIFNWQSVVLNDHQASVLDADVFQEVIGDLDNYLQDPGQNHLRYKPEADGSLRLPHEFAIGFRYGHSQLRNRYTVSMHHTFELFNNLLPGPDYADLRGSRALEADRAIDWPYFINPNKDYKRSNRLDTLITNDLFNLPESAVPDVPTKFLGNLPQRNLIRSREIGLTSGERLFDFFFGAHAPGKLSPDEIDPNAIDPEHSSQGLFEKGGTFQTPLWYYILKEAELGGGLRLGKLGSRLVGEVVAGAIYYNTDSYVRSPNWTSAINGSRVVKMKDLVDFIHNQDAT